MAASPLPDRRAHPPGLRTSDWRCDDGWTLRRFDWPAERPRGRLLFLSGRADFGEKYLEAMAHWHARGWSVTSFDWRGQGGSIGDASAQAGAEPGFDTLLGDLSAFVAGNEPADAVVAHSMGAHLALRLILERGWRPRATVLVSPMLGVNAGLVPAWTVRLIARTMVALGFGARRVWRGTKADAAVRQATLTGSRERFEDEHWWAARHPGWAMRPPSWAWLASAYASMRVVERTAEPADMPRVMVLLAARERLVSNTAARRITYRLWLETYELAGAHELLREADPERLAALAEIDDFFAYELRG